MGESGGSCLKYLKGGWNRKEGRGNKDFEKGSKLGQVLGVLKKGEDWNLLRTIFTENCMKLSQCNFSTIALIQVHRSRIQVLSLLN